MTIKLSDPLTLPCGAVLPNRLAKGAMTEGLATSDGQATPALERLYGIWSDGGCGMLLSGNIQIDRDHLERPGNVILQDGHVDDDSRSMDAIKAWTAAGTRNQNHFWAQISHGGREVQIDINPTPKAPSSVKLGLPGGKFGTPQAMTIEEIEHIIESFANAAKTCQDSGFTGVQLHAAHGYLLSSFLNPRANQRTDDFGGSLENRARILISTVKNVRERVGPKFPIAVKLNSADFQKGGFKFTDSLQVVQWLEKASVDLIEISGGNYEMGAMMGAEGAEPKEEQKVNKAPSTIAREAYFLDFAKAMQDVVKVPLMVTGGFRTKAAMEYALESGGADVIGLARPLCGMTDGAKQLLEGKIEELPKYEHNLELLPASLGFLKRFQIFKFINTMSPIFWCYEQLDSLGRTGKTIDNLKPFTALINVEKRSNKLLAGRTKGLTAIKKEESTATPITTMTTAVAIAGIAVAVGVGYAMRGK